MSNHYTPEEMRQQWDKLAADWVVLANWASQKGHPVKPVKMRPDSPLAASRKAPYPDRPASSHQDQP